MHVKSEKLRVYYNLFLIRILDIKNIYLSGISGSKDESVKKRKTSPIPQSAKKKTPEEKKLQGFERGLEPEKILGN